MLAALGAARDVASVRRCAQLWPRHHLPYLRLSQALLGHGQGGAALAAARKALRRAPDDLAARHAYADAWAALGRADMACDALLAAVALAPHDAPTRHRLGLARLADGRPRDALAALRRALRLAPGYAPVALAACEILRLLHRGTEAEPLLRAVLAHDPVAMPVRLALARCLLEAERPQEALDMLDAMPPPDGAARRFVLPLRAAALARLGQAAGGAEFTAAAPLFHHRDVMRAAAGRGEAALRAAAAQIEAGIGAPDEPMADRIAASFSLSHHWFERGRPDAAFACLHAGHRLLAIAEPFSRPAHERLEEAMLRGFTAPALQCGRAGNEDPAPVFIVGMPRSGTTLAEQILAAHAAVFGAGEREALGALARRLGGPRRDPDWVAHILAASPVLLDAAAAEYLAELHALAPGALRIVDKMPGNFQLIGLIGKLLPGAKIIHCVRDSRDIGFSIYSRHFTASHPYAHDLEDLGWYIAWQARLMRHWQDVSPNPILRLHLHEWIRDFNRTLHRLLAFLDLPPDPACARFFALEREVRTASRAQVREPVNTEGMGRWRLYERQLMPMIDALQKAGMLQTY